MATLTLANWVHSLTVSQIPPPVLKAAQRSLYNYIGCTIGGSKHPTVSKAQKALKPFFGPATCSIIGHSGNLKSDAQHAALLNAMPSHVHDYDDTHLATIIHPTGPVASALLAYIEIADRRISGGELLIALTAGVEASCHLGLAVWPSHYDVGCHITSTTGSLGAAVAVGKLMGLSIEELAHAIGIAATQATGLREMFGSDTKSFHPARAAQNGLLAAQLAKEGFTSSLQALEARRGWANVVVGPGGTPQLERYFSPESENGLGRTWEVEQNAFKPFPCGIVCHLSMDAAIQLHQDMKAKGLRVEDIVSMEERVHHLVIELTSKRKPKDGLEGKFSVFHGSAVALLFGKAGPAEYADGVVTSGDVIRLRDKIHATPDESIKPDEAYLAVKLKDGSKLEKHVEHAIGSLNIPMTDEQLTQKFVDQYSLVLEKNGAERASDLSWGIGQEADVAENLKQL